MKYSPGYVLASRLGISSNLVSRFSGCIFIGRGSKKKWVFSLQWFTQLLRRYHDQLPANFTPSELPLQTNVIFLVCSPCGEHRTNIGLNLKFNKKNEEVPGYTKRTEKEWLYSAAVEELLAEYLDR